MQEAICLAPEWSRGYLRAGRALTHLERYQEARPAPAVFGCPASLAVAHTPPLRYRPTIPVSPAVSGVSGQALSALHCGLEMEPTNKKVRDAIGHADWLVKAQQREQVAAPRRTPTPTPEPTQGPPVTRPPLPCSGE